MQLDGISNRLKVLFWFCHTSEGWYPAAFISQIIQSLDSSLRWSDGKTYSQLLISIQFLFLNVPFALDTDSFLLEVTV